MASDTRLLVIQKPRQLNKGRIAFNAESTGQPIVDKETLQIDALSCANPA
jgi:hypothetical protein